MTPDEAIASLSKLKQDKQNKEQFNISNGIAKSLNTFKDIIVNSMVSLTKIIIGSQYPVTVKNFPKTTTINNKELSVKVSNFPKDKDITKVEVTNQPKIEFSTASTDTILRQIELESSKVPPLLKSSSVGHLNAIASLGSTLDNVLSAIKNIKLSPNITVKPADVKVDAPIINVPKTIIPPFPKKITADVDMSTLEDKIDELITETQYSYTQPVKVSNPGDFPVSLFNSKPIVDAIETLKIETVPTDATRVNPSLVISNTDTTVASTKVLTKTIGATSYTKTLSYNSAGELLSISVWS